MIDETSISLQDLLSHPSASNNCFGVYISDIWRRVERVELIAIDIRQIPALPLRRQACKRCTGENLSCEHCAECHKKKVTCCRGLSCLYDYNHYERVPDEQHYRSCACFKEYAPSSNIFAIDWRLAALLQKFTQFRSTTHNFYLHLAGGTMWATKQSAKHTENGTVQVYHQDNFGVFHFHESQTRQPSNPTLAEANSRHLSSLLKLNVRRYLSTKEAWDVSNLEEECQQIADSFFSHKKLQAIKMGLQSQSAENAYSNMPSHKYQGKYTQTSVSSKKAEPDYRNCSDWENEQLIFSYCHKTQLLFIRNAKYFDSDDEWGNLRAIRVRWNADPIPSGAIWFKDKKGDIFAIFKGTISIFKFHLPSKSFQQFKIDENQLLNTVEMAAALLYIPHKDTVYYFNHKDLKKSFFFTLYRPKGGEESGKGKSAVLSKHSCTSVTLVPDFLLSREKSLPKVQTNCKAVYVMEDYKFKAGKEQRRELVPVIYLLCQRKAYLPVGIGVYRTVHHEDVLNFSQLPSLSSLQTKDSVRIPNFSSGIHFTLIMEKSLRFCLFTFLDGKSTLLSGMVEQKQGREGLIWSEQLMALSGCSDLRQGLQAEGFRVENHMPCSTETYNVNDYKQTPYTPILLTDVAGAPGNNQFTFLGQNSRTGKVVQFGISCVEGSPQWRLFDLS